MKVVHFDIVDGCQLRCLGCPNSGLIRQPTYIAPELFRRSIRHLDVERVEVFRYFSYGEPLLHPQLETIGRILRDEASFSTGLFEISTNAQSPNDQRLATLIEIGVLNRLVISCDGDGTPASYETLRPPAKWDRLMGFLEFAQQLKRSYPSLEIITRSIIRAPDDARRWREILFPFGVTPEFRGWKYLPQSAQNLTGREPHKGAGICFHVADPERLHVNHRGQVIPCCIHPCAGVLGNLSETPYSAILTGRQRRTFLRQIARHRQNMPICGLCEFGSSDNPGPSAGTALDFAP